MSTMPKDPKAAPETGLRKGLTSYGDKGFSLFLRKAFIKGAGYTSSALDRPVIGIINTGSAYNPCHGNMPQLIEAVKRGIMLAGGLPMEFPTISIHESFAAPTSMYLRNLMSMDTEEMLRAQPMDAVVMIGGCDKTVPAQMMGAASAGLPAIQLITGSMLTGSHRSERVGACTDCRRYWGKFRAGEIDEIEKDEVNDQLVASVGTCSVVQVLVRSCEAGVEARVPLDAEAGRLGNVILTALPDERGLQETVRGVEDVRVELAE